MIKAQIINGFWIVTKQDKIILCEVYGLRAMSYYQSFLKAA